ncbi:RNA-binding protein 26 [Umbelopsis nana]
MLFAEARSEDLKKFLTQELAPICDADPDVLAQYVLALLRNNKPSSELKDSVSEQLEDFLKDQTISFVSKLFNVLESGRFMDGNSAGSKSTANDSGSVPPAASNQHHGQSDSRRSQHHESSEDEDDDDRNFKHRRQRSEPRDDGYRSGDKRRHDESESSQINKYMRDSQDFKRMNNGQPHDGRGRGRGGARGRGGRPRQQCRDYNERGYCMRGDLCPYDHGTDRIIVNDRVLKGQFGGNPPGPIPPNLGRPPFFGAPNNMGIAPGGDAYDPENSGLPVPPPDMGSLPLDGGAPFINQRGGSRGGRGSRGRGRGGFAVSGGRSHQNRHNSTIVVENIPKEHCVIDKVHEYFKQFGTITNISLETELSKAIVQYSSHQEADAAYSSPEVIFNNRFVKVYWQKAEAKDQEAAVTPPPKPAAPKTYEPSPEVVAAKAAEFAKLKEIKQKQQQARLQTMLELQKSKEQLIQKQIQEQKELMEKLANAKTPEERSSIMSALNNITNPTSSAPAATTAPVTAETDKASDEQTQTEDEKKEETAEDLKAKLARLEAEAAALGIHGVSGRGRGRGRGGFYAARGRGSWPRPAPGGIQKSYRLDNRTTKLMIKNHPQEDKDKLRQHFEQFGQLEGVSYKDDAESIIVQFKNRREAEVALARGANTLQGKPLEMAWYNEPTSDNSNREPSAPAEGEAKTASPAAEGVAGQ